MVWSVPGRVAPPTSGSDETVWVITMSVGRRFIGGLLPETDTDPLVEVGAKDLTAHVDFTGIAVAAQDAGLTLPEMALAWVLNHPAVTSAIIERPPRADCWPRHASRGRWPAPGRQRHRPVSAPPGARATA